MKIHDPGNYKKIEELFVCVSVDENDNEGLIAINLHSKPMPLVFTEEKLIDKFLPLLKKEFKETGKKIRILKFTSRETYKDL